MRQDPRYWKVVTRLQQKQECGMWNLTCDELFPSPDDRNSKLNILSIHIHCYQAIQKILCKYQNFPSNACVNSTHCLLYVRFKSLVYGIVEILANHGQILQVP